MKSSPKKSRGPAPAPRFETVIATVRELARWKRRLARASLTAVRRARLEGEAKGLDAAAGYLEILQR